MDIAWTAKDSGAWLAEGRLVSRIARLICLIREPETSSQEFSRRLNTFGVPKGDYFGG